MSLGNETQDFDQDEEDEGQEYVIGEEGGGEDYEQEESYIEDEEVNLTNMSMVARAGSSRGEAYPGLEVTEWSGSSDESQERLLDYEEGEGEVDDDTLQEFGMTVDEEALPSKRRRR